MWYVPKISDMETPEDGKLGEKSCMDYKHVLQIRKQTQRGKVMAISKEC
jgi:hypothetical protein